MTARIVGTGSYVPEKIVTNEDLAGIVDTSDEWIRTRSGIRSRHLATDMGTSEIAVQAALRALEMADVDVLELDCILVATSTPEKHFPSCACEVQGAIGAKNAVAFDISAACSGFVFAMSTMDAFMKSGIYQTGLVIGADVLSKVIDWKDRGTCVLFGDGAGAAVVRAEEIGVIGFSMGADGSRGDVLSCLSRSTGNFLTSTEPQMGYMSMNGQEVFKFAVKKVPECICQVLQENHINIEDVKYFMLHQANVRILEAAAKRLGQPLEKFPIDIEKYGNTSGASIAILLDEWNRKGMLTRGDKLVLAGFGAGLTWGALLLEW
ncbi:MAG: beta-ketoacyl-ACP synthase III [bacterium]|nr:beta-ketoacyl-ACP synthase III [bacterium]